MEKILEMRSASFLITVINGEVVKCDDYDGETVFDLSKEIDNDIAEHDDRISKRKFKVLNGGKNE